MMEEEESSSPVPVSPASREAEQVSSPGCKIEQGELALPKKKRNLPGMPDPEAEVIALSPTTLLATNRFVCEICNKGFQRDQNLQLHRRGHNLPWKLRQRTSTEVRKRVYVCPESSCVHHNPTRALGDLTGIKKHFSRKHGEKKWKCERCSKKYAVLSDWKAHMKTCGTREYKCDCGTLFSRRDSFITHTAFCHALSEAAPAKTQAQTINTRSEENDSTMNVIAVVASPPPPPLTPSTSVVSPALSIQSSELPEIAVGVSSPRPTATTCLPTAAITTSSVAASNTTSTSGSSNSTVLASVFAPSSTTSNIPQPIQTISEPSPSFSTLISSLTRADIHPTGTLPNVPTVEPTSLSLSTSLYLSSQSPSFYAPPDLDHRRYATAAAQCLQPPTMSATALLQKAAQMGAATSNASSLRGFGLTLSSSYGQDNCSTSNGGGQWDSGGASTGNSLAVGLGLGLRSGSGLSDLMMSPSSTFGSQLMTRDLLGLGMAGSGPGGPVVSRPRGLLALLTPLDGSFSVTAPTPYRGEDDGGGSRSRDTWDGGPPPDKKPCGPFFQ